MITKDAVWLVTGCSRGFGRAIAEEALGAGYRVAVTARRASDIADLVAAYGNAVLAVELDVADAKMIREAVATAENHFGSVDVLVNNAGYGYLAAIEEGEEADTRALFEANLFGPLNLVKAVLPGMRARRRGHIVNISSIAGHVSYPGIGYYNMVKFAIEALSGALAKEVAPLGIGVTTVAPGAFRTGFRGPTSLRQSATRIADYAETAGRVRDGAPASHGIQRGDPVRGARAIIAAIESERPPLHLLIGADALDQLRNRLDELCRETRDWEDVTRSTDLQPAETT